jgi:hypothetical protein
VAVFTVQTPSEVGSTLTYTAANAGGDSFAGASGQRYLILWRNTGGANITPTIDDPNSATPVGATAWNPDMVCTVIPLTTGATAQIINASRFRDSSGNVNFTYSATPTGVTCAVVGPF